LALTTFRRFSARSRSSKQRAGFQPELTIHGGDITDAGK
jgi:hypothetical protein